MIVLYGIHTLHSDTKPALKVHTVDLSVMKLYKIAQAVSYNYCVVRCYVFCGSVLHVEKMEYYSTAAVIITHYYSERKNISNSTGPKQNTAVYGTHSTHYTHTHTHVHTLQYYKRSTHTHVDIMPRDS